MCTKFWSENLKGGDNLGDLGVDVTVWTEFMSLRIGPSDGLLWTRK